MAGYIRVESNPTFRDLQGRFARAEDQLIDIRRDEMREEGRRMQSIVKRYAPKGQTGKFAGGIRWRSYQSGAGIGFSVSLPEPLGKWIVGGTRPHIIRGNPFLAFFWKKVGRSVVFRYVNHPGTKPNPFLEDALDEWKQGGQDALRRISTRYIAILQR